MWPLRQRIGSRGCVTLVFKLILNSKVEAKNIAEPIVLSKKAQISIATSGVGSATHMTLERFKAASGANSRARPLS